ncbi:TonB-dependent receptor [Aestuariibacter sp. A3R04]|uniref:TonB-dependent receptor n=1 Tax=Aestuariibacter sp. A3R04 TaxID=2841571 RepID=UPI001C08D0DB|nr:TonB-dependent receptor [Aestuariibacter sp. A3R04]MBU3021622.1 TonB-dependent receptor [Aestuariibacter sp. A3R04]
MQPRSYLTLSILSALGVFVSAAHAQQTSENDSQEIEEIVALASPIKDSQTAAIEAKRVASNVMEVIAADTIGRFPDQNLADSLGRVPGLAIERDQGQARYINFRGMPFRYTAIGFDGIDVPGAENGRIPRFDSFPSVITRRIEVNKAVLPSMTGEAVAGYVNIETFNPFDREGFSADLDVGMGEQQLGGGDVEKFGSRLSFSNDSFGVMGFYSKNSREQVTDNREYDLGADGAVNSIDMRSYKLTREDEAYGGRLEYRLDNGTRFFISSLYSEFTDLEQRNQYVFNFATSPVGPVIENAPVYINRLLQDGEYSNSTQTITLGTDFLVAGWDVALRYNLTETEFSTQLPIIYQSGLDFLNDFAADIHLVDLDLTNIEDPIITSATPVDEIVYGPTSTYAYKINSPLNVDADKIKLDASKDLSFLGLPSTLSIGGEYNKREAKGENLVDFDVLAFIPAFGGAELDVNSFLTEESWASNTSNSINANYWNNAGLRAAWEASGAELFPAASADERTHIEEDITAAYAMMESQFNWGSIVYGLRIEQTDYSSVGTLLDSETGEETPVDYSDDFTNVLPSVHLNYNINDKAIARVSFSSGVNRPTYQEWRAAASINPTATPTAVSGGNPSLKAEESYGLDGTLEYYFAPASIASASIFSRFVDNVIYTDVQSVDGAIYGGQPGETWELSGPVNGSDGEITGIELNLIAMAEDFVPALMGWGVSVNATFVDSEFTTIQGETLDLPGTSDLIYNASVFYEDYGLSARLNYQYRDEWISPIEDPTEYWGEQNRLDFNIQYVLPENITGPVSATVYFNANNLTDETDLRYAGNNTVNQSESYGRRFLFGLRLSY